MADCIFCKIAEKEIPSKVVYEDDRILCFHDLEAQAPVHVLIIPKKHIASAQEISSENSEYIAKIFEAISIIAKENNLENGFRVVNNCGEDGGQTVGHIHFHLLARRNLAWPPG